MIKITSTKEEGGHGYVVYAGSRAYKVLAEFRPCPPPYDALHNALGWISEESGDAIQAIAEHVVDGGIEINGLHYVADACKKAWARLGWDWRSEWTLPSK